MLRGVQDGHQKPIEELVKVIEAKNVYTVRVGMSKEIVAAVKSAVKVASLSAKYASSLRHIMVSFRRYEMTILATDLHVYLSQTVNIDADVTQEFSVLVDKDVLKAVKAKSELIFSPTFVSVDGIQYLCPIDTAEYPKFPQVENDNAAWVDATYFEDLAACALSASTLEARPILTCIHHRNDEIYATDGLRLLIAKEHCQFQKEFNLPARYADLLAKTFSEARLRYDGRYAMYSHEGTFILVRLFDGRYPEVSRIIPSNGKTAGEIQDVEA